VAITLFASCLTGLVEKYGPPGCVNSVSVFMTRFSLTLLMYGRSIQLIEWKITSEKYEFRHDRVKGIMIGHGLE
jgi:hypothetical protein